MGNGERVRFWEEILGRANRLLFATSSSHGLSQSLNWSFARMCVNSSSLPLSWDFGFRRHLNEPDVRELLSLLSVFT